MVFRQDNYECDYMQAIRFMWSKDGLAIQAEWACGKSIKG